MDGGRQMPSFNIDDHRSRSQHSRLRIFEPGGGESIQRDLRSVHSEQIGNHTSPSWVRGQEFSSLEPYDPLEDADQGQKMFLERKQLHFYQLFRYADFFDWILMIIGITLAVGNSLVAPFMFYCAGITMQDMVVYQRCKPHVNSTTGLCTINGYCDHTFEEVGHIFLKIVGYGWLIYIGVQLIHNICFTVAADRQTRKVRAAYFESIVMKDMAWFDLYTDRDFAKAMTEEVTHIRLGIGDVIPGFLNLICTIILMIVVIFSLTFKGALSFFCFVPLIILMVYMGNWAERKRSTLADTSFVDARNFVTENLSNIKMIKMYEMEKAQCERFAKSLDAMENTKTELKWMAVAALSTSFIWLILNVATSLVFWFGHGQFHMHNEYCFGKETQDRNTFFRTGVFELGIVTPDHGPGVYFCLMFISLHALELPNMLGLMQIAKNNATVVFFIIDWKSRINNLSSEGRVPKKAAIGRLDFVNVTFRYPKNPEEVVLNIRALTIFTGQFIVFAGPPRSGKTTILRLVPRLYDVCSGYVRTATVSKITEIIFAFHFHRHVHIAMQVAVDSVNLQNYSVRWLRQQISIITEEPVIFTGTVSENILFGKLSANQYDIERACELAGIHDRIANLPNGYDTIISSEDLGYNLTRHEKRQLCLARVYLHKSRFILLDNPLRPEDDEMEPLLLSYINQVRNTCTIIMASSTVNGLSKRADCVYYMENGSIVEYGTHIQLIQAKGKYFHRLEETINCSLESKKKFDSQLKAFKFSQALEEKKRSSLGFGSFSGVDGFGNFATRNSLLPVPLHEIGASPRTSILENFVKLLGGEGRSKKGAPVQYQAKLKAGSITSVGSRSGSFNRGSSSSTENLESAENAPLHSSLRQHSVGEGNKRKSQQMLIIQSQQKLAMATASLESAYNKYATGGRRRSSGDNYLPHGFGLMGFQRLNFARPMTNYTNLIDLFRLFRFSSNFIAQIHKQRHRFLSNLPIYQIKAEISKGPTNTSKFFGNSVDLQSTGDLRKVTSNRASKKLSNPHVRFSFIAETDKTWPSSGGSSSTRLTHTNNPTSNPTHYGRGSMLKPKNPRLSGGPPEDILAIAIAQSADIDVAVGYSSGSVAEKRDSSIKTPRTSGTIQHSNSLKNILEVDELGMEQQEVDTYLAEYQAAVHVNAQTRVPGYWCDVFYVCKHDWLFIIPGIIASIGLGLSYVFQTVQIGMYFHTLESDPTISNQMHLADKVFELSLNVVYIGLLTGAAAFVQEFCFGVAGKRMIRQMREKLFSHILTQDLTWFDDPKHDIGILTFQIYVETTIVHHMLLIVYGIVIQTLTTFTASVVVAVNAASEANISLVFCFIALMPVWILMLFYVCKHELTLLLHLDAKFQPACDFTQEFLTNIVTWISLGAEPYFITNHTKKLAEEYKWMSFRAILATFLSNVVKKTNWLLYGIFVCFTLKQDFSASSATSSAVSFVMITTELLIYGAYRIGDQLVILGDTEFGKSAAHKLMAILISQPCVENPSKATTSYLISRIALEDEEPPEIALTNIFYKYSNQDKADDADDDEQSEPDSLRGITLAIHTGTYVAVVGPPGSGKSTLCNILLRMIDPTFGSIEFNGEDVLPLSPKMIRRGIGLVEYDPCLFGFSIDDNIRLGACFELSDSEMEDATKTAICHYDILDLPNDYRTLVQDMEKTVANFTLKQRIAFSRALVRKPKVFIVDDATTSVDTVSDHKLFQVLTNIREKRTLIVFSHKIEPIRDADMIYVLWEGQIVERGTDSRLLNNQGHYYEMFMTQKVLSDSMRNSPNQLTTIRYNVKHLPKTDQAETCARGVRASLAGGKISGVTQPPHTPKRHSSVQMYKFLDEKRKRNEMEKEQRREMLEKEAKQLEKEAAARENKTFGGKEEGDNKSKGKK
ncbi:Multidrug resistance protein 1B [Orchesella cincta]|uniref:Multidrug resistance protein 1B n=1 Tax=Orchesella cincta TaxID=48709 RepID=A0A1D2NCV1_ORCCI|nr:Multidrug resistance protein 1B [Orchesella cincta]